MEAHPSSLLMPIFYFQEWDDRYGKPQLTLLKARKCE